MNEKLDTSAYKHYTTAMAGPYIHSTLKLLVSYACDLLMLSVRCNDVNRLTPDYRSTMPLLPDDTCDLTATDRDCLAVFYNNFRPLHSRKMGLSNITTPIVN